MALAEVHTKAQCRYVFIRCLGYIARLLFYKRKKLQILNLAPDPVGVSWYLSTVSSFM